MKASDQPVIIIKKRGNGHAGHHGGSWKVAYADFMTAMMAFFIVMWVLGLSTGTRQAIQAYFQDPVGFMKTVGGGKSAMAAYRDDGGKPAILPSRGGPGPVDSARFQVAKAALEKIVQDTPELRSLAKNVSIEVTPEGLRVELLESSNRSLFFESGSAQMRPDTLRLLARFGHELARMPNRIAIEGHTDARPYVGHQKNYTNWELSADRANSARRALSPMLRSGQVVEVRGLADRCPRVPSDPFHYSNRRVSILMLNSETPEGDVDLRGSVSKDVKKAAPDPVSVRPRPAKVSDAPTPRVSRKETQPAVAPSVGPAPVDNPLSQRAAPTVPRNILQQEDGIGAKLPGLPRLN